MLKIKSNIFDVLAIILLSCILIVRLYNISSSLYPFSDPARDYLVAHHIVKFGEKIQLGPLDGILGNISTPIYFYFLALFLTIKDSILTLQVVNTILHIINVGAIYILTKKLFSAGTAIIASLFIVFSYTLSQLTINFFQPNIMTPFISVVNIILLQAYIKRSFSLLLISNVILVFAAALHKSAFAFMMPFLLISLFIILKRFKKSCAFHSFVLVLVLFVSLVIFYLPTLYFAYQADNTSVLSSVGEIINSPSKFLGSFIENTTSFANFFLFQEEVVTMIPSTNNNILLFIIVVSGVVYLLSKNIDLKRKTYIVILLFTIFTFISLLSFIRISILRTWYFSPIWSLFIIFISEIVSSVFTKNLLSRITLGILISILLYIFSQNISPFYYGRKNTSWLDSLAKNIFNEVNDIRKKENRNDVHFFVVKGYLQNHFEVPYQLWNILEKQYDDRFIKVDSSTADSSRFKDLNTDDFIFLICDVEREKGSVNEKCIHEFLKTHINYTLTKEIASGSNYQTYLFRK